MAVLLLRFNSTCNKLMTRTVRYMKRQMAHLENTRTLTPQELNFSLDARHSLVLYTRAVPLFVKIYAHFNSVRGDANLAVGLCDFMHGLTRGLSSPFSTNL